MAEAQKTIGACVRYFREKQRLSQEAVALKAGISYQYLSGIETGKENFSIQVIENLAAALNVPLEILVAAAFDNQSGIRPPLLDAAHFRRNVPLPNGLTFETIEAAVNHTQMVIHRINQNMLREGGKTLQSLIQGNNFSGLVSNILANSFDQHSPYKHNHHQRYPDLVNPLANAGAGEGLEIKTTIRVGKGGESHNGHDGWHVVACYCILDNGDIEFIHLMFAWLNGHRHRQPDWKYVGSQVNAVTGSRRTETFNTNEAGNTKLRDGSAFLDASRVNFSRWRHDRTRELPLHSIWAKTAKP